MKRMAQVRWGRVEEGGRARLGAGLGAGLGLREMRDEKKRVCSPKGGIC
jgi:hypothetical protein